MAGLRDTWAGERALILSLGVMVLALELINTAIERTVDRISMDHDDLGRQDRPLFPKFEAP